MTEGHLNKESEDQQLLIFYLDVLEGLYHVNEISFEVHKISFDIDILRLEFVCCF